MNWRNSFISAGLSLLGASGLHRVAAPLTRGRGVILTFHQVQPERFDSFAPNRLLSISPAFLDRTIRRLRGLGYLIVPMDEALRRLQTCHVADERFAVLTFDDGFRDNLDRALPVLERHNAPATFYVTTGFADRTARLWWIELEEVVRRADRIRVTIGPDDLDLDARTPTAKRKAFAAIYWRLRRGPETRLLDVIGALCDLHGIDSRSLVDLLCLDWAGIDILARHSLVTIGAHTVSHPMLAKYDEATSRREILDGKAILEARIGRPVRHLAYPVGDLTSAGHREFRLAAEAGFASAVTTRPGLLFPSSRDHLHALPRLSVNGNHQRVRTLDVLLSGAPFFLWNGGRRVAPL